MVASLGCCYFAFPMNTKGKERGEGRSGGVFYYVFGVVLLVVFLTKLHPAKGLGQLCLPYLLSSGNGKETIHLC